MNRRSRRVMLAAAALYGLLTLGFLVGSPDLAAVIGMESIPRWLGFILFSLVGPGVLLSHGLEALPWFAALTVSIVGCLACAERWRRRFPQEEWFAFPLLAALGLWVMSGWLLPALGI